MTEKTDKTIRVGLVGYGYAGKAFYAPLTRSVPRLLRTVIGLGKRELLGAKFPDVIVCRPDEVPIHPGVDLVVIASPNGIYAPDGSGPFKSQSRKSTTLV